MRVYDLAKEYGMKGPQLAKMLKELGFEKLKSHMSVLDDATELHARAVIEAQGLAPAAPKPSKTEDGMPRKKALPKAAGAAAPPKKKLPAKKALPTPVGRQTAVATGEATTEVGAELADAPEPAARARGPMPEAVEAEVSEPALSEAAAPEAQAPEAEVTEVATSAAGTGATTEPAVEERTAAAKPKAAKPKAAKPKAASSKAAGLEAAEPEAAERETVEGTRPEAPTAEAAGPEAAASDAGAPEAGVPEADVSEAEAAAAAKEAEPEGPKVKKLLVPEQKAKVIGRIELPQEAISDAKRRSAPGSGRNPSGVDRNLRRAALRSTQSRSASRSGPRSGPGGGRRGPGMGGGPRRGPGGRGGRQRSGPGSSGTLTSTVDPNKVIEIEPPISIKGLSEAIGVKVTDLIAALTFKLGVAGKNINSFLSNDEVELVGMEVGRNIKIVERREAEDELIQDLIDARLDVDEIHRAPVVTFMGHVDHGKTTLLDALRDSDVARHEAGGITQHVGAYRITRPNGEVFVVLDTPGHEAFTAMRARGARVTDVVVLVVAADDGVMPQTEEALAHAKDADVPIIVAINKCDRPDANPMQVMQQLSVKGLQAEEWGGNVQMVQVSATEGTGLDELAEQILLQAEILELKAKPTASGEGIVIECKQTPEQGVVVNVLVTNGTIRLRDRLLCGESLSRIRGIIDDHGEQLTEAGPSMPVALLGITSLATPGDKLFVVNDTKKAKEVVEDRQRLARNLSLAERSKVTLENISATLEARKVDEIKIIIKADVMGSLEPIRDSLSRLNTDEVRVNIVHSALGGITEADVSFAEASGAIMIGFNTVADQPARIAAERAGVDIRFYNVIYELLDDVKLAMEGMLRPDEVEKVTGHAEIRAVFRSSKFGNIAGCYVLDGQVTRGTRARLSRDGKVVYTGSIATLRREKDDVREVKADFECGLTLKNYNDIQVGDQLEFFDVQLVKRTLS